MLWNGDNGKSNFHHNVCRTWTTAIIAVLKVCFLILNTRHQGHGIWSLSRPTLWLVVYQLTCILTIVTCPQTVCSRTEELAASNSRDWVIDWVCGWLGFGTVFFYMIAQKLRNVCSWELVCRWTVNWCISVHMFLKLTFNRFPIGAYRYKNLLLMHGCALIVTNEYHSGIIQGSSRFKRAQGRSGTEHNQYRPGKDVTHLEKKQRK